MRFEIRFPGFFLVVLVVVCGGEGKWTGEVWGNISNSGRVTT